MPNTTKTYEPGAVVLSNPEASRRKRLRKPKLLTILFSLLLLIALFHFIAVMHTAAPVVVPTDCLGLLRTTDYTQVVHLKPRTEAMGAVQLVNQLAGEQAVALVSVTGTDAKHALAVYVFGCSMRQHTPKLTTLFSQHGLVQGTVEVSLDHTLVLSSLDSSLSPQQLALVQPMQQNIYREYRWHNGTFEQVLFPSLYPVTSRGEAEQLQQQANSGQQVPWSNPLATAEQMAKDMLKWPLTSSQDTVVSNNGTTAQVNLFQQSPQMEVNVTLSRLIQQTNNGLWFVTAAHTSGISLKQALLSTPISSPLLLHGSGALTDGQTTATLFDHTLSPMAIGIGNILTVDANGNFSGSISFTNSNPGQPGLLLIQSLPPSGSSEMGQVLLTNVIIG
ncbi:MAG TPA: hypothetical protein VNG51_11785 [Ktedonobacteraceae bacterium]|nr:hypothetical protein [Ktedonobacteraceae bacterium]